MAGVGGRFAIMPECRLSLPLPENVFTGRPLDLD
jgi:hypothetical protein